MLLSSLLFGRNHFYFGPQQIIFKSMAGLVWALLLLSTGSIIAPFASHLTFQIWVWWRLWRRDLITFRGTEDDVSATFS